MNEYLKLTTDVKKQHTVPRFLLSNFGFKDKSKVKKLFTFDKKNSKKYQQSILDATTRNTFYNIENHPDKLSLEPILGIYESEAAPIINKIIEKRNISHLTKKEKIKISTFIAIQRARSYGELQRIDSLMNAIKERFRQMALSSEEIELELNEHKNIFFKSILDQKDQIPNFLNKSWILYETNIDEPFYISDNPITLHNDIDMGFWGNLGIALEGIQIHLPISSTLTLALICPSISSKAISAKKEIDFLISTKNPLISELKNPNGLRDLAIAFQKGTPIKQSHENVTFLNSLQVSFSEQFVFCEKDKFNLIEEMIKNNDKYKSGPRIKLS